MMFAALSVSPCILAVDLPEACTTTADFAGEIIVGEATADSVQLHWTPWEDNTVREYLLSRAPADCDASGCLTPLARIKATSTGLTRKSYSFTDTAPEGAWIYYLSVVRTDSPPCLHATPELLVSDMPPCDVAAQCAQVAASLAGRAQPGLTASTMVRLRWLTRAETGSGGYRLSRFDCDDPDECSTEIATISATGSCGKLRLHRLTDTPPTAGAWSYRLEVLDSGGRSVCSTDVLIPE
jgi:hypothetical protein